MNCESSVLETFVIVMGRSPSGRKKVIYYTAVFVRDVLKSVEKRYKYAELKQKRDKIVEASSWTPRVAKHLG
jgi:hypothetical protein